MSIKNINPKIKELLNQRKIDTPEALDLFLNDDRLSSPFEMQNIKKICDRIKSAISNNEQIIICGDYDADGTVSTAMLYRFFKEMNYHNIDWYIPHRVEEGYGISALGLENLVDKTKKQLFISVDNGIAAFDAGNKSIELGVDLIITDHHDLIDNKIPNCYAVLNPKIEDENKKYRFLAGAGVALYLIRALKKELEVKVNLDKYLLLATIASIADVVPLLQENRILVKKGLSLLKKMDQIVGLKCLFIEAGINLNYLNNVSSKDIGFKVVPMLNAAGRLEGAEKTIQLLIEDDEDKAIEYAETLKNLNLRRRAESDLLYLKIKEESDFQDDVLIFSGKDYHQGIIGVVAGKLKHEFNKPTIIISIDEKGIGKASCRSIEGFNIKEAIESLGHLHLGGGGHYMAAGFSIQAENIEEFKLKMNEYFKSNFNQVKAKPIFDIELTKKDITKEFIEQLKMLEPFGAKNDPIKVKYSGAISEISIIKEKHLLIKLDNDMTCWYFFEASKLSEIQSKLTLSIIGEFNPQNKGSIIIEKIVD